MLTLSCWEEKRYKEPNGRRTVHGGLWQAGKGSEPLERGKRWGKGELT